MESILFANDLGRGLSSSEGCVSGLTQRKGALPTLLHVVVSHASRTPSDVNANTKECIGSHTTSNNSLFVCVRDEARSAAVSSCGAVFDDAGPDLLFETSKLDIQ